MPIIPNYILQNEDLSSMDDLLQAKRKMLNKMKIEETEIKYDGTKNVDSKLILSNFDGADKLIRANIALFKKIDNKIALPSTKSSIIRDTEASIIEIFDIIDIINSNYKLLYNTIKDLLPFNNYIDNKRFINMYRMVGENVKVMEDLTFEKIQDRAGNIIFSIPGAKKFTAAMFIDRYDTIYPTFIEFYNIWKQFIKQYNYIDK